MGLYTQPPEVQADLLAYWQILHTDDPVRFSLLGSKRLADESYLASLRRRGGRAGRQPVIGPAAGRRLAGRCDDVGWWLAGDDVGGR